MIDFHSIKKTQEEWEDVNKKLYAECKEFLLEALNKYGTFYENYLFGKKLYIELNEDYGCCVRYNGGRHPEYDSNCFSNVECVCLRDGKIYLDIEDASDYNIENVSAEELFDIADSVNYVIKTEYQD